MKKLIHAVLFLALAFCLNSCDLIDRFSNSNSANEAFYRSTTQAFTNSLVNKDFDKCINLINFTKAQRSGDLTGVKVNLDSLRSTIVKNFGTALEYSFMSSQKHALSDNDDALPPNTTLVLIEFHNTKDIGVLQLVFDDKTLKIDNMKSLNVRQPIPNMTKFWLFGLAALVVLAFNIYALILVWRSILNIQFKLLYSVAIIVVKVPSVLYNAASGLSFKLFNVPIELFHLPFKLFHVQYLIGINFQKIGYLGSVWEIGIPLAAIFTFCKLKLAPFIIARKQSKNAKFTKTSKAAKK
jgi:hypothetical protein